MAYPMTDPWHVHFFQRHIADDETQSIPAFSVAIGGLTKPKRSAADSRDYARILSTKVEFLARRTVLKL